ncbi:alpha/beta fold hydrolase [Belliella pelovolcani]|uniref:alpha/beta fold hydrolase n=1 Tax=Belliella pelovolcani TaxID=529505 RepID=UPI0039187FB7
MISFTKQGKGNPLILLHGFCESKEMWQDISRDLAHEHRVYCLDLPGFGDSLGKSLPQNIEEVAVILQEWMEEQSIHSPIIIGHSLGGYVTLALSELMGSELRGIGLFHSTAFADDKAKQHTRNKTISFVKKHGVDKFIASFVPPLFAELHKSENQEAIDLLIEIGKKTPKETVLNYIKAMRDRKDRFEVWKTFQGPKLLIAGELDQAVKIDSSRAHQDFTTAYHELADVGHMGMFEAKEKCLEILKAFLEQRG